MSPLSSTTAWQRQFEQSNPEACEPAVDPGSISASPSRLNGMVYVFMLYTHQECPKHWSICWAERWPSAMAQRMARSVLEHLCGPESFPTPGRVGALKGTMYSAISIDPILLADEPISPKKPKSIPEPNSRVKEAEATSPWPSEWTSVRFSPEEDTVGQDVLAIRVLVTSEDSRYAQIAEGWRQQ